MRRSYYFICVFYIFTLISCTPNKDDSYSDDFEYLKKELDRLILNNYCLESEEIEYVENNEKFDTTIAMEYLNSMSKIMIENLNDSSLSNVIYERRSIPQKWLRKVESKNCEAVIRGIITSINNHEIQYVEVFLPQIGFTQILCIRIIKDNEFEILFLT